ncbi:PfkB domain protein OS=Tsukamurella paurometabola (strain ATCC 8368 / DSM / CCUG 35730 / CIP 100753 / JCM 10117 / KCTC 9821 / NBRC 16120 / NCIMB 702349/ NCTC 13040) OX=521096 GN=Tpau_3555 PE=4 SV=1 [Tsukamurella paurometabola]|uniref:PfkB domain protein n=1 Tax=Tsukamurella paurometabola (strain ATCC 8368 / DSM 20162 / CCUG 35730 / CIP 100753 / JCM 10117 / KCTC 9821 / NBRC 16120 / NCIMB 702349 / NCTC 13040) TaxID=521096 RepID=D5UXB5_TSUPD|nr:PfkB domain protein [Tsukamurella paurometabola DSM 20162]SUP38540.1 ribokinase [Tsukamurella paurometabola]
MWRRRVGRDTPQGLFVGLATVDVIQRVDELPRPNAKVTAMRQDVAGGGPALNAAATFAALGGVAVLAAPVGDGPLGHLIRDDLRRCAVELIDLASHGFEPPVSAITVDAHTGDRQIVSYDGSGYPDVVPTISADGFDVVLLDGHGPAAARSALTAAVAAGVPTVLDAGRWRPVFADLLPRATHVICSADFIAPEPISGPRTVAVSDGAGPIRYVTDGVAGTAPVPSVAVIDTLGAGDVLHGAFAAAIARGAAVPEALHSAAGHASDKCRHPGVREWLDTVRRTR